MTRQSSLFPETNYIEFLDALKQRIRSAQVRAVLAVNQELIHLYWQIGHEILLRQQVQGWGTKVIERLAQDLKREFPDMSGFSKTNLKYMRAFAEAYGEDEVGQRCVDQLPWRHNIALLTKLKDQEQRFWYAHQALHNGWSRDVLVLQIETDLFARQGGATTNFARTLPPPQSDLVQQTIKDPYNFSFLTLEQNAREQELERGLVTHIRDFLLELGLGFAFVGSQYPIEVSGRDYRLDLLFFHLHLRCFVVVDLKVTEFIPEYSGKMNFYVSAVDDLLRHPSDNPTIGLILCRSKDRTTVEYALRGAQQPIGVSTYTTQLPHALQDQLPTIEQLEMEMAQALEEIERQEIIEFE